MQGPVSNLGTRTLQKHLIWLSALIKMSPDDCFPSLHAYLGCRWSGLLLASSLRGKHMSRMLVPQQKAGRCENRDSSNKGFLLKMVNPHRQIINGVISKTLVYKKKPPLHEHCCYTCGLSGWVYSYQTHRLWEVKQHHCLVLPMPLMRSHHTVDISVGPIHKILKNGNGMGML